MALRIGQTLWMPHATRHDSTLHGTIFANPDENLMGRRVFFCELLALALKSVPTPKHGYTYQA